MSKPSETSPQPTKYRLPPVVDKHVAASKRMILAAAARTAGRRAIVLGPGRCQEIPLAELAAQFEYVLLVDLDREAVEQGLAAADLPPEARAKIEIKIADLIGLTNELQFRWREALAAAADPHDAIERFAAIVDGAQPAAV